MVKPIHSSLHSESEKLKSTLYASELLRLKLEFEIAENIKNELKTIKNDLKTKIKP